MLNSPFTAGASKLLVLDGRLRSEVQGRARLMPRRRGWRGVREYDHRNSAVQTLLCRALRCLAHRCATAGVFCGFFSGRAKCRSGSQVRRATSRGRLATAAGHVAPGAHVVSEKQEVDGAYDVVPFNPLASLSLSQQRARLPVFKVGRGHDDVSHNCSESFWLFPQCSFGRRSSASTSCMRWSGFRPWCWLARPAAARQRRSPSTCTKPAGLLVRGAAAHPNTHGRRRPRGGMPAAAPHCCGDDCAARGRGASRCARFMLNVAAGAGSAGGQRGRVCDPLRGGSRAHHAHQVHDRGAAAGHI